MVGKTRLIRTTGSPLIGGHTHRQRILPWVIGVAVAAAIVAALVWYFVIR